MAIVRSDGHVWLAAALALGGCTGTVGEKQDQVTGQSSALTWTDGALTMTVEADVEPVRCEGLDPTLGVSGTIAVEGSGSFNAVAMITNVDTGEISQITLASASDFAPIGDALVASFMTDVLLPAGMHSVELCFALTTDRGLSRTRGCLPAFDYEIDCSTTVDTTPPTITGSRDPAANANGWNNTDVTASFMCADGESGIASCTAPVTLSAEGAGQSVTGTAVDNAGNMAQATVSDINIDKTAPTVSLMGTGTYSVDETVNVTCEFSDALSGVESSSCSGASGPAYSFGLGEHAVSGSATDNAGNMSSASGSFTVVVTPEGLCNLVESLVSRRGVAVSLCAKLRAIDWALDHDRHLVAAWVAVAFKLEVRALTPGVITPANSVLLRQLVDALVDD